MLPYEFPDGVRGAFCCGTTTAVLNRTMTMTTTTASATISDVSIIISFVVAYSASTLSVRPSTSTTLAGAPAVMADSPTF